MRPYTDYLHWLASQDQDGALHVWKEYLAGAEPTMATVGNSKVARIPEQLTHELPVEHTAALEDTIRNSGLTLSNLVQCMWAILLARLSGREDVVFGVTMSGRPAELLGIEKTPGFFINTVPMRVQLERGEPLGKLLSRVQANQAQMIPVQHTGLTDIQRGIGLEKLFDTVIIFENYPLDRVALAKPVGGLRLAHAEMHDASHYPVALAAVPGERLHLRFDYDPGCFTADEIRALAMRYVRLLEQGGSHLDTPWQQISFITPEERAQVLEEFNPWREVPVRPSTLPDLFERAAERSRDSVAVLFEGQQLSYAQLNARANQWARVLAGMGDRKSVV